MLLKLIFIVRNKIVRISCDKNEITKWFEFYIFGILRARRFWVLFKLEALEQTKEFDNSLLIIFTSFSTITKIKPMTNLIKLILD